MHRLPPAATGPLYDALPPDHPAYAAAARALAAELGIAVDAPERLPGGSLPVLRIGPDAVLKLYPPFCAEEGPREADVLRLLGGRDGIPAPRLLAAGERDGWRWVAMQRLAGCLWSTVDGELTPADRRGLALESGRLIRRIHGVPWDELGWSGRDWTDFITAQRAAAAARQRRLKLDPHWADQIDGFLAGVPLPDGPRVLLHTEVMREHVFVSRDAAGWRITGIFDFEPARVGVAEYEMASVGLFVAAGDPALLAAFLDGYGLPPKARDLAWQRRCLAWALLHQYSHLGWYLKRLPAPEAVTLDDLARRWWPV